VVKLVFIRLPDGKKYTVDAAAGQSLMAAAITHNIPRILGECGGACACGTCHVYIARAEQQKLPPLSLPEEDILAFLAGLKPESRLACQIPLTEDMEELTVYLP